VKNVLSEQPTDALRGRLAYTVDWVQEEDLRDKVILDIGCGYGWFEYHALQRDVRKIIGIEQTEEDLKTAKDHLNDRRLEFRTGSALELPFPNETFDTVVAWEVIEHIPKNTEPQMLREVHRVLRPGGKFYLSTPYQSILSNITDPAWWLIGHRHYLESHLLELGGQNGFDVLETVPRAGYWAILASVDMYFSKWVLRRRPLLESFTAPRETAEFAKDRGFVNLFAKYRKRDD